jgi:hypothetical protein
MSFLSKQRRTDKDVNPQHKYNRARKNAYRSQCSNCARGWVICHREVAESDVSSSEQLEESSADRKGNNQRD